MLRTLTGKVTVGVLLIIVVLVGGAVGALQGAWATEVATRHIAEIHLAEAQLNEQFVFRLARAMTEIVSAGGLREEEELEEAEENLALARGILGELAEIEAEQDDLGSQQISAQRLALVEALEGAAARVAEAIAGDDEAGLEEALEELETLDAEIERLIEAQEAMLAAAAAHELEVVAGLTNLATVAIPGQYTVIGLLALLATWLLHRGVVRPVRDLAKTAVAIGEGQFDQQIPRNGVDEVGVLQGALHEMVQRLRERDAAVAAQAAETQAALAELERRSAEQARLVDALEQQREVVRGLSVPVLPIGDRVLAMPLVGALSGDRLQLVQGQALQAIEQSRAHTLLIDVTGVPIVDEEVAAGLLGVLGAARLLGTEVVLVGIRPEVAQTLVGLNLSLDGIKSYSSLQAGIQATTRHKQR